MGKEDEEYNLAFYNIMTVLGRCTYEVCSPPKKKKKKKEKRPTFLNSTSMRHFSILRTEILCGSEVDLLLVGWLGFMAYQTL